MRKITDKYRQALIQRMRAVRCEIIENCALHVGSHKLSIDVLIPDRGMGAQCQVALLLMRKTIYLIPMMY